jgi:hypothetical protein
MPLDKPRLLAHIKARADHPKLVVFAVLTGLAVAIERGDFDESPTTNTPILSKGTTENEH